MEKELLCESFFAFMKTNPEVGREHFFSLLGNALLRVGYNKVKPVIKKGRRVAYTGMAFKKECSSSKVSKEKTAISAYTLRQWMMLNYCEGGPSDVISAEDLWLHFRDNCKIQEGEKSVFFSLLGNSVFKNPPFLKVRRQSTRSDQGGKISTFQNLMVKHRTNNDDNVDARQIPGSCGKESKDGMELEADNVGDIHEIQSQDGKFVDFKVNRNDCGVGGAEKKLEKGEENGVVMEEVDDNEEEEEEEEEEEAKFGEEGEKEEFESSVEEVSSDSGQIKSDVVEYDDASRDPLSDNEEESSSNDDIFRKYHKKINDLLPCHLPGRPTSFQSYLKSVFPDRSNFNVERHNIHSLSASTSVYKDARIRAFVAACFPPIKVGSFAGECNGFTFAGDVFPQFSQVDKGYFNCEICIPYCKWAILNNHPYPSTRSKQASVDAILAGTAKLAFSGVVQMREHSLSKCHVERVQAATVPPPVRKDKGRKEKRIADYFTRVSDPLNVLGETLFDPVTT